MRSLSFRFRFVSAYLSHLCVSCCADSVSPGSGSRKAAASGNMTDTQKRVLMEIFQSSNPSSNPFANPIQSLLHQVGTSTSSSPSEFRPAHSNRLHLTSSNPPVHSSQSVSLPSLQSNSERPGTSPKYDYFSLFLFFGLLFASFVFFVMFSGFC